MNTIYDWHTFSRRFGVIMLTFSCLFFLLYRDTRGEKPVSTWACFVMTLCTTTEARRARNSQNDGAPGIYSRIRQRRRKKSESPDSITRRLSASSAFFVLVGVSRKRNSEKESRVANVIGVRHAGGRAGQSKTILLRCSIGNL